MQLNFDPDISYECVQCGRGCFNSWNIEVEPPVMSRLKGHALELRVIQERGQAFVPTEDGEGYRVFKNEEYPSCGFLDSDMLCSIHREISYTEKPLTCQQYPFIFVQTPDGEIHVSATYSCTAVRGQVGPALAESRTSAEDLIRRGGHVVRWASDIQLLGPWRAEYSEIQLFESELRRRLQRDGFAALAGAVAGVAAVLSDQPPTAERVALEAGRLAQSWERADSCGDDIFSGLGLCKLVLTVSMLKFCLLSDDPDVESGLDTSVVQGGVLDLPDFRWNGPLTDLEVWINQAVGSRFDSDIERFQRSLLFRKAHLTRGGLLPGLWLLWVNPEILRLLTGLWAWKHEREPVREDLLWALERVETKLIAHSMEKTALYEWAGQQSLSMLGTAGQAG